MRTFALLTRAALGSLCVLAACLPAVAFAAPKRGSVSPPSAITFSKGWQIRDIDAKAPDAQPAPPDEGDPDTGTPTPPSVPGQPAPVNGAWRPARVPGVFDADARPELFPGTVKQYRLRFKGPRTRAYTWALHFEQVRRRATVYLNGRKLGKRIDPYTPFQLPARGLRRGRTNTLVVTVDSRKDPYLPEAWWNYGGIVRPVTLRPVGRVSVRDLGLLSDVRCKRAAASCSAGLLIDGRLSKLPRPTRAERRRSRPPAAPKLTVALRSPKGVKTKRSFSLLASDRSERRIRLRMRVPKPTLWSPDAPNRYSSRVTLSYAGRRQQVERQKIGLRSVEVKRGLLYLNNRRINLRGASMHDDFNGHGAALTGADMDRSVAELKELGANVTRSHYVQSEAMLRRLDRAGIMVWNQAPVWQRDSKKNKLSKNKGRANAYAQMQRTVIAARNHPAVITHSIGNELSIVADRKFGTKRYITYGARMARRLDPTLPISLDINGRPGYPAQRSYAGLDMLGINQYFGWYPWVKDINALPTYLAQMRRQYPTKAFVMTEFGAEARPEEANGPATQKGSYAFQVGHLQRTMDIVDRSPVLSGAIHWTLREFEIFPGWTGGAGAATGRGTRHHKGVLTYEGAKKPGWQVLHDHYVRTPLYP